ncbi:hypothetical protein BRC61_06795 [Halobacteriales archaeon QH_10_65_19]|nr:MAG: hypothetical protein BRC61_06795 [Halobacteriales archaeon QH_10_65_19]
MAGGDERGFLADVSRETRVLDALLLAAVPVVLVGVAQLPAGTREQFVFERESPTVLTAYTSYFVHLDSGHLLGNLAVYLVVAPVAYLLAALSGRRQLFWSMWVTLLTAFPFALSVTQLSFPAQRTVLGFSGINAGFVGLLSFLLVGYAGATLAAGINERDAPVLLFVTTGLIALTTLPSRAPRLEIAAAAIALGLVYVGAAVSRTGVPTIVRARAAVDRPGYVELAGASGGLLVGYPVVGFQRTVADGGVLDVYVHLLGYCLAFIVVFVFVLITDEL